MIYDQNVAYYYFQTAVADRYDRMTDDSGRNGENSSHDNFYFYYFMNEYLLYSM